MKKRIALIVLAFIMTGLTSMAGAQAGPGPGQGYGPQMGMPMAGPMGPGGRGMGAGMRGGGPGMGKWWTNSELVKKLGLSDAQVQKIEKAFQDHRTQLLELHATLIKQEAALEPLIEADRLDEAQAAAQIDKVAQARASLEKSNGQLLLAIRRVLTAGQWKQLRSQGGMHP